MYAVGPSSANPVFQISWGTKITRLSTWTLNLVVYMLVNNAVKVFSSLSIKQQILLTYCNFYTLVVNLDIETS